jgi:Tfp pilus assembly protein PilF
MRLAAVLIFALLLFSCATEPRNIPYQSSNETQAGQAGAVEALQRKAVEALQQQSYVDAIEFLQRAIRIEPRNPRSWHYLAQTYWERKDYDRCLEMVERSFSYSRAGDGLDAANQQLKARCQDG